MPRNKKNAQEGKPQNILPIAKRKSSLKKKTLPDEDFIEPNLNRILPMEEPKSLSEMTREERLEHNNLKIYLQNRLPKLKEEKPGLRGNKAAEIITKEWLKLKANIHSLRLSKHTASQYIEY